MAAHREKNLPVHQPGFMEGDTAGVVGHQQQTVDGFEFYQGDPSAGDGIDYLDFCPCLGEAGDGKKDQ
jgi:hypothetical protein